MLDSFLLGDPSATPSSCQALLLGLFLAFASGQGLAWVYMYTHQGLSYSRAFVVSLVVMPVIVSLVMNVMANNLVTAFGLMAVFAIVRFRNILRDTLDTVYVLGSIVLGMACGMQRYTTAVTGAVGLYLILLYMAVSSFGSRHQHDFLVHLRAIPGDDFESLMAGTLSRHCLKIVPAGRRTGAGAGDTSLSYRLLLRDPGRSPELLEDLRRLPGILEVQGTDVAEDLEF